MSLLAVVLAFAVGVLAGDWCRTSNSFTAFALSEFVDFAKRQIDRLRKPE